MVLNCLTAQLGHMADGVAPDQTNETTDARLQVILVRGKTLADIEMMHMIRKGQWFFARGGNVTPAARFYSLAA